MHMTDLPERSDESPAESQRKILNRLRRAQGQLSSVIAAVESDAGCRDVVVQLAAVSKALDRAGFVIISSAMKKCMTGTDEDHEELTVEELEKLFLSLA
jgi:DNA-binding FrmR family transcriptional regulator